MRRPILFTNAQLIFPDFIGEGSLLVDGGQMAAIGLGKNLQARSGDEVVDLAGAYLAPGLVDLHNHGAMTHDFVAASADGNRQALAFHLEQGVTSMLATVMTESPRQMAAALELLARQAHQQELPPNLLGIHIEGPFLHPDKRGAHQLEHLRTPNLPQVEEFYRLCGSLLRILTLAPELPNGLEVCQFLAERQVLPAIGHTKATLQEIRAAFAYGAHHFVHANNAVDWPIRKPREEGWLGTELMGMGTLLTHSAMSGEIIADGYHVPVEMIRLLIHQKGPLQLALVSDASSATGCQPGDYALGGLTIELRSGNLVLTKEVSPETGVRPMAGSATPLLQMVRNVVGWGYPLHDAIRMATLVPAQIIKQPRKGCLRVGHDADLIVLNPRLELQGVFVKGKSCFRSQEVPLCGS